MGLETAHVSNILRLNFLLYCMEDDGANKQIVRRLRNLLIVFFYPRAFNHLLFDATASM